MQSWRIKRNCQFSLLNDEKAGLQQWASFTFQKNSPYVEIFNKALQKMKENGIIDRYLKKFTVDDKECYLPATTVEPIGPLHLSLVYWVMIVFLVLSIIILVLELLLS